ncbi:MAG: DNA primase [bacterium]
MNHIPEEIINQIRENVNIVEIISSYIPLKKSGRDFKAPCPFHSEKTPSFFVNPLKGIFHCFGCGVGGNAINFIMLYNKINFPEAIELLAERLNIKISKIDSKQEEKNKEKEEIFEINKYAKEFYKKCLNDTIIGKKAYEYINSRNLKKEVIEKFELGYASNISIFKKAQTDGYSINILNKSGLIVFRDTEQKFFYDRFCNRIIFPLHNLSGKICGFGGRILDKSLPKYLNSPETICYSKSHYLYGLYFAKEEICKQKCLIIVEGYMDLLRLYQVGILNAVAISGTSLTEGHIKLIKRFTDKIIIIYDGDEAGKSATFRGLDLLISKNMETKIVVLPQNTDPDNFIEKNGKEEFLKLIENAYSIFDYKLKIATLNNDIFSSEGKIKIVKEILPFILQIVNEIEKAEYIKKIAFLLKITENIIIKEIERFQKKGNPTKILLENKTDEITTRIGKSLIRFMLEDNEIIKKVKNEIDILYFKQEKIKKIIEILFSLNEKGIVITTSNIMNYIQEKELVNDISKIIIETDQDEKTEIFYNDYLKKIKNDLLKQKINEIKEKNNKLITNLLQEYKEYNNKIKTSNQ